VQREQKRAIAIDLLTVSSLEKEMVKVAAASQFSLATEI